MLIEPAGSLECIISVQGYNADVFIGFSKDLAEFDFQAHIGFVIVAEHIISSGFKAKGGMGLEGEGESRNILEEIIFLVVVGNLEILLFEGGFKLNHTVFFILVIAWVAPGDFIHDFHDRDRIEGLGLIEVEMGIESSVGCLINIVLDLSVILETVCQTSELDPFLIQDGGILLISRVAGQVKIMFHIEAIFPDPVLGVAQVNADYLAVGFNILFKKAIVLNTTVFIILDPVEDEVGDHAIAFVFGNELSSEYEIDMIGFLPQVGSGGAHHMEIKSKVQAAVKVPAEDRVKVLFFFCTLRIEKFGIGFINLIVLYAIVLIEVGIEGVDSIVESAFFNGGEGDEVPVVLADISKGGIESRLFIQGVIVLEPGYGGIVWVEVQHSEFFEIIIEEADDGGISRWFRGFDFHRVSWQGKGKDTKEQQGREEEVF